MSKKIWYKWRGERERSEQKEKEKSFNFFT